jgi:hypothetical protein
VVAAHGGQVEVDARSGGGALFRIHLPAATHSADAGAASRDPGDDLGQEIDAAEAAG